ncbi:MAG: (Fe-S)-binding protein [Methanomassiliicoccales archaeon]|nr:MAG: (Fe-S)-binding protein [Methanomassiliicoccales archaeon]
MTYSNNGGKQVELWFGCTTRFYFENTIKSIKSIMDKLNINYGIIDDEKNRYSCCASTLWGIGLNDYAESNRLKMKPVIEKKTKEGTQVVSPCPGCTQVFIKKYELSSNPLHITQFLSQNLDKMKFANDKPLEITYHDSCHLAKGLGVIEEPREILNKIPNLKLKELSYNGKEALCCGSGGGLRAQNKDLADSMSSLIVKEAESLGATVIITACPFCERSFNFGRELIGAELEVKNLLSMVDEHLP